VQVLVLVKATDASEAGGPPNPAMMDAMGRFNDKLRAAGLLVLADGLQPSAAGVRVGFDGADRTVTPGPFAPAEDLVAGFWIWEVKDLEEAIAWVRRCPNPMPGSSTIEIRPFNDRA
jgi:hypothetical protein